jgi:hypothetical protein
MSRTAPIAPVLFADVVPLRRTARPPRPARTAVAPPAPTLRTCESCERAYRFTRRGLCRSCYREFPEALRATFGDRRGDHGFDALPPADRLRILRSKMSAATDALFRRVFAEPRLTEAEALARAFGTPLTRPEAESPGEETSP